VFQAQRALLSVSDKTGIEDFARRLAALGIELVSSGGTAGRLREAGVEVKAVSELTGAPEMMGGRVKTLHPVIHGGILQRRDHSGDRDDAERLGIAAIDIVVVNLYPFDEASRHGDLGAALEQIDIGGPAMVRAAAKNHPQVLVVTSPAQYGEVIERLEAGSADLAYRGRLALAAFRHTARYDGAIALYLQRMLDATPFAAELGVPLRRVQSLRYGENPHQAAAFYDDGRGDRLSLAAASQLQGKELSFNNLGDLSAALSLAIEFDAPAAAVMKHANPSGCALAATLDQAYEAARLCDPVSAFGSVVALNRPLDEATAARIKATFVEAVIAPLVEPPARELLRKKKALRLLELPEIERCAGSGRGPRGFELRSVLGGYLLQERDPCGDDLESWTVAGDRSPSEEELAALRFAWKVCRHVKSNAILLGRGTRTIGVGAGQMSRVDSVRIAVSKAREHGHDAVGSVLASDAFFPFRDGIDEAHAAGVRAVVQPGGSKRDAEVIEAANEHGIAMVLTGRRHFLH